jgi:hypothetical protein
MDFMRFIKYELFFYAIRRFIWVFSRQFLYEDWNPLCFSVIFKLETGTVAAAKSGCRNRL